MNDASRDGRLRLIGWLGSILFHVLLILFATSFLLRAPKFTVTAGATSTEIEFTTDEAEPAPAPVAVQPPTPPAITPPPLPVPQEPPPIKDAFTIPRVPAVIPPLAKPSPAISPAPSKPAAKAHVAHQTKPNPSSSASKGAVAAEPDELHNDPPVYPDESRLAHEEGVVLLRVEVTASGDAVRVTVQKSSGFFRLDQAARRAVQQWRFHPGLLAGVPIPSTVIVPVNFKLE